MRKYIALAFVVSLLTGPALANQTDTERQEANAILATKMSEAMNRAVLKVQ